ncbi:lysozyme inhibitor LprI family protein [Gymnodinialimonas sp. 57CJ19]|uniref:lysozyme inhibitor LprI family protein n=1 Tax=Gymnodinialimonas sp. 57CJ19 TaxID=3138498 RepID=UPI0031345AF2
MSVMRSGCLGTVLAFVMGPLSGPVVAQDWDCDAMDSLPQQGIIHCLGEQHAFWDSLLNNAYQQVIAERDGEEEERLRVAQRAWIIYRDATCEMEADAMGAGSGEAMVRLGCLARLTERRARDLETYLRR